MRTTYPELEALSLNTPGPSEWLNTIEQRDKKNAVEFDYCWEEKVAVMFDENQLSWQYKPRTFAVEWDEEGNFVDSFTPAFYLPAFDLYVEVAATDYRACGAKARKVRLLRQQHPEIRIEFRSADQLAQLLGTLFFDPYTPDPGELTGNFERGVGRFRKI